MTTDDRPLLDEQIAYYRARAEEYDEWFFRRGRYDRGEGQRRAWFAEVAEIEAALRHAGPDGHILELACGTGLWTRHLVDRAASVTAIDASPEVLRVNVERVRSPRVEYVQADLFQWRPAKLYDFIFFGFWLSHVPEHRFEDFWRMVRSALRDGGQAFFVDNLFGQEQTATNHKEIDRHGVVERKLNDGRAFNIVKIFYDPALLERRLRALGWTGYVRSTGRFFLYGCVHS
jgi:demethylmenaquinone methyltransferase/2-methoxy-6-polyprenyl-1,4-benzoquinol methylase